MELPKSFEPDAIERRWYPEWEARGYFAAALTPGKPAFSILLPPPNVTGTLHMGHAFQHTLMDALIRYHRMLGDNTLWQAGTDHAGIATQIVVERMVEREGTSRAALGRDAFLDRVWAWKEESGSTITRQMRRLGTSCDWSRERFTMDEGLSRTVTEVFVRLYREGLIYRGKRLVNWDPKLGTAVSDLEVESVEEQGSLWHIRYPRVDGKGHVVVATTRPETMLGDVAVAVHPEDPRYQDLIGQAVHLPLTDRTIPVIADTYVDREFGTGCLKITPAHDFNDWQIGQRHKLPPIGILTLDAKLNEHVPEKYRGLDRFEARKSIVADLEASGLLEDVKPHKLMVPRCGRTNADRRADAHGPVVRQHGIARETGVELRRVGRGALRPGELDHHLQPVAHEHPGLVHLAPALVGPPHPGVVRRGRQRVRRPRRGRGARVGGRQAVWSRTRMSSTPGSPPHSGRSRRSTGRPSIRRRAIRRSTSTFRLPCSSPGSTSSSSGSRAW